MDAQAFLTELDRRVREGLARLAEHSAAGAPAPAVGIPDLLEVALQNELEAAEEAALWLVEEEDVEVKLALARQCGDEAKHYRLIEQRLRELGRQQVSTLPARPARYGPLFGFLKGLKTTAERLAAGAFTREGLAQVRNEVFIQYCEAQGDAETARLYREIIQPDEGFHHEMGRRLLVRFVRAAEDQDRVRHAVDRTLEIASEVQEAARRRAGIRRAPGC